MHLIGRPAARPSPLMRCLASRFCQSAVPVAPRQPRKCAVCSHRLPVVATSEFWWEDEQEFDALTEVLQPKHVYLTTTAGCQQQLQQLKASTTFVAAFTAPDLQGEVEQLWQQLGRAGPPLFLKVRLRSSLQECEQSPRGSRAAAEQLWQELTSQTWRTELDYGLAGSKDATAAAATEQVLVIARSKAGVDSLLQAVLDASGDGDGSSSSDGGGGDDDVAVVGFSGWNQGEAQQRLSSWKQLAPKQLQMAAVQQ